MIDPNGIVKDYAEEPEGRLPFGLEIRRCPRCGKNAKHIVRPSRKAGGDQVHIFVHSERIFPNGMGMMLDWHLVTEDIDRQAVQPDLF